LASTFERCKSRDVMIRDLSETLSKMLDDENLKGRFADLFDAHIAFDRPDEGFKPAHTTVNLFLYDVREDVELRSNEPIIARNKAEAAIHRPPLRIACSYLVTAWPVGGTDAPWQEHRLLSQVLMVLSQYPKIPDRFLQGQLKEQRPESIEEARKLYPPSPMITAQADGLKNPHEFWTAIGNKLRPSISVTVTISMQPFEPEIADLVTGSDLRIGGRALPIDDQHPNKLDAATLQGPFRVVGKVTTDDQTPKPIAAAKVELTSTNLTGITDVMASIHLETKTDDDGVFRFTQTLASGDAAALVPPGAYTLRVTKDQRQKEREITVPATAGGNYNVTLTG